MDLIKKLAICGAAANRPLSSTTEKMDRFTNADQDGVNKTKVSGNAPFVQTFLPATVRSGTSPTTTYATYKAITDGGITIVHDGTEYAITGLDISAVTDVIDMMTFLYYLEGKLKQETSDSTIRVTFDGTNFTITCGTVDIYFIATDGVTTDIAFLMAIANGTTAEDTSNATVLPYRAYEGYTCNDNDPANLTSFYEFNNSLAATFGYDLQLTDPFETSSIGTPSYTTIGNLKAVYTEDDVMFLQSYLTVPADAFEFSQEIYIDNLPGAGETAMYAFLTDNTTFNKVYCRLQLTETGSLELYFTDGNGDYVNLTASGLSAGNKYTVTVSFDGTTGVSLSVNNSVADADTLGSTFDPSVIKILTLLLGVAEVDGEGGHAFDGKIMNVGLFGSLQTSGYWLDIYNGGITKPLYYRELGTVEMTFRDVPEYVNGIIVDFETPIISTDEPDALQYNIFGKSNLSGLEDRPAGVLVDLPDSLREDMDGCIVTATIDPNYGDILVSGVFVTFVE